MLKSLNRLPVFIFLLALSRIVLLGLLVLVTHGREISNDVSMHIEMIRNPLCILTFNCPQYDQYPPLLPLFETVIGTPADFFFSPMITVRLTMMMYELIAAFAFFQIAAITVSSPSWRALLLASFIALPMMFMTSTIMGANTMIGGAFVLVSAWLAIRSRAKWSAFLLGLGTIAGKQFLVLPLLATVLLQNKSSFIRRALAGCLPIIVIFGGLFAWRVLNAQSVPLLGFKPDPYFGTNFWVAFRTLYDIDISKFGTLSGVLALGAGLVPIALGLIKSSASKRQDALLLGVTSSLFLFFSLFYHVNPDYFIMCVPLLLVLSRTGFDLVLVWLVSVTPWIGKFLQLLVFKNNVGSEAVGGKAVILNALSPNIMAYAETALVANQFIFSALTIIIGLMLCRRIIRL